MIAINITDVLKVLGNALPYLIGFAVVLLAAVIIMIAVRKKQVKLRKFIRKECLLCILAALVVCVNLICFGPMYTMISLASGSGSLSDESVTASKALCEEITEEGIVLLKNTEGFLPLKNTKKLNVFGWASAHPVYAGAGSGALSDVYEKVSLLDGLTNAGFEINTELVDFYNDYNDARPADWTLPEPDISTYTDEMMNNAKEFSDTAMVVIGREGGEGADCPEDMYSIIKGQGQASTGGKANTFTNNTTEYDDFEEGDHYLQLSVPEKKLIDRVCKDYSKVIVVYNGANTMELGWVDEYPQIQSVLWCAGAGQTGFNALGKVLDGEVNPSGKTTDTFVYDLKNTPTWNNFGTFYYDNMSEHNNAYYYYTYLITETMPSFVDYVEGIYVGYRYYETAAAEGFIDYDATVQYPFGYGLSYTSFTQEMGALQEKDGQISFDVTVTNTGDTAGKDVVEAYYNPPYYNGGIEKSSANLIAFDKTDLLEPGESQTLTASFNVEDMASYDENIEKAYVLENGTYTISINSNSHDIIASQDYEVPETIVYNEDNKRSTDLIAATNQFDNADGNLTYLSRADGFANYAEATKAPESYTMPEDLKAMFVSNLNYDPKAEDDDSAEMPVTGAKNNVKLADLRGLDYDDPLWDSLLDELTVEEMDGLISMAGYQTKALDSVGKVDTVECDGPVAINNSFTGQATIGFPPAVVIANTWNTDLAYEFGHEMAIMAKEMNVNGWYAPAMNTHRSAFGGRNFEYYSEDGVLAGKIAAQVVTGSMEQGVYPFIKHFALNDQESNRVCMLCTWTNEQAIREIYLKPFEYAVKEGKTTAVMAGLNYIGPIAAGSNNALLNTVLRDEWGFKGMVITDYFGMYGYQNADQQIRNGCDGCLVAYDVTEAHVREQSASGVAAMKKASHNIMYTVVNSSAYENGGVKQTPGWVIMAYVVDALLAAVFVGVEILLIRKYKQDKNITVVSVDDESKERKQE